MAGSNTVARHRPSSDAAGAVVQDLQSVGAVRPSRFAWVNDQRLRMLDRPLLILWIAGATLWAAALLSSAAWIVRRARNWRSMMVDSVHVLVSDNVGPALVGILTPRIVLPAWALDLAPSERALILAHELEHRRAHDPLLLLGGALLLVAMPWNAPLWYALGRLRLAIEADCDRRVLRARPDVRAYCALLLQAGSNARPRRALFSRSLALTLAARAGSLSRRIDLMTTPTVQRWNLRVLRSALLGAAGASVAYALPAPTRLPVIRTADTAPPRVALNAHPETMRGQTALAQPPRKPSQAPRRVSRAQPPVSGSVERMMRLIDPVNDSMLFMGLPPACSTPGVSGCPRIQVVRGKGFGDDSRAADGTIRTPVGYTSYGELVPTPNGLVFYPGPLRDTVLVLSADTVVQRADSSTGSPHTVLQRGPGLRMTAAVTLRGLAEGTPARTALAAHIQAAGMLHHECGPAPAYVRCAPGWRP